MKFKENVGKFPRKFQSKENLENVLESDPYKEVDDTIFLSF